MKKIVYVQECSNSNKKILLKINKFFNVINIKEDKYYLPVLKKDKLSEHNIKRLTNKINKLLEKNGVDNIALSEYLNSNQLFKNYLYSNNINILNGRFLFKCLIYKIIEYIFKIKNKQIELR